MAARITARDVDVLNSAATLIASDDAQRRVLLVFNSGPNAIFVGPSDVSITTGYEVPAGTALPPIYYSVGDPTVCLAWYAIAGTADQAGADNTRVLETFAF